MGGWCLADRETRGQTVSTQGGYRQGTSCGKGLLKRKYPQEVRPRSLAAAGLLHGSQRELRGTSLGAPGLPLSPTGSVVWGKGFKPFQASAPSSVKWCHKNANLPKANWELKNSYKAPAIDSGLSDYYTSTESHMLLFSLSYTEYLQYNPKTRTIFNSK